MEPHVASIGIGTIQEPVRQELDASFDRLRSIAQADFPLIDDVNDHLLRIKGKMFRPTLLLLSAQSAGTITDREITLSAIVELIHVATLIHDDAVDHSVLRRGQPSVHAQFSHEVAVIMGDYLYSRAIHELVLLDAREPLRIMSRVTNELTVGEMREVVAYDFLTFSERDYEQLIQAKTASLMSGACEIGALVSGNTFRQPLKQFGRQLGMAFQVTDDLLDYTESEDITGKPAAQDLREHKVTLPLIAALPNMTGPERAQVEALMADPSPSDDLIATVIHTVEQRGGIATARDAARAFALEAEAELACLAPSPAKDALLDSIAYAIARRQ